MTSSYATGTVSIIVNGRAVPATLAFDAGRVKITLATHAVIAAGDKIEVTVEQTR